MILKLVLRLHACQIVVQEVLFFFLVSWPINIISLFLAESVGG